MQSRTRAGASPRRRAAAAALKSETHASTCAAVARAGSVTHAQYGQRRTGGGRLCVGRDPEQLVAHRPRLWCAHVPSDRSRVAERTIIYWDHGPQPASFRLASGSAVLLSGNDQTADDVIVKSCGYLVGAADLCVVTSDQALRGRCRTQRIEAPTSAATTSLEMLHGIYLSWLLESDEQLGWRGSAELIDRYASPHRCRTETTSQRAQQAQELFEELARLAAPTAAPLPSGSPTSLSAQLASWYQGGCDGLGVSRASRRGNPVYSYQHTLAL